MGKPREDVPAPDLVFFTGDVALSGQAKEYKLATSFFDDLLKAAGLERGHLFVVPGNHDVDRGKCVSPVRSLPDMDAADKYFHSRSLKDDLTRNQGAFLRWRDTYFKGIRKYPSDSTCGPGESIEIQGNRIGVLCLNSALFCQDDSDHEKLWIGRRCLDQAIEKFGTLSADLRVALIHHPLDWLIGLERGDIETRLKKGVDVLLRDHRHENEAVNIESGRGSLLHMAAGRPTSRNGPSAASTLPSRARSRSSRSAMMSTKAPGGSAAVGHGGRALFYHAGRAAAACPATSLSQQHLFTRRASPMLAALDDLSAERVLVLHGPPGVGKSELAREFARRQRKRYPGGTYFIDASSGDVLVDLVQVGKGNLGLSFPPGLPLPDQCEQTLLSLHGQPTLLIYDNARSAESIRRWLPRAGMTCHTLITTVSDRWDPGWPCLPLAPLPQEASLELIRDVAGPDIAERYGQTLAKMAGGLPVQLCSSAATLAYEDRRGRLDSVRLAMTDETQRSFGLVYGRLEPPLRLLLQAAAFLNCQRIVAQEFYRHVSPATGWSEVEFQLRLDACRDLHLLEGDTVLRMHQLFAAYVLGNRVAGDDAAALERVRHAQRSRMLELARALSADPASGDLATALTGFPLAPREWDEAGAGISAFEGEAVGKALVEIGKFAEARPWYERAVEEKGDAPGRVDHESLGRSLHQVGFCLSSVGEYEKARPWFERAVAEAEKGDVHGCVNHESFGGSLHAVGFCLSSVGKFEEARPWYERAVAEKEKGDVHGRVDHQSLEVSLRAGAECLRHLGLPKQAGNWERRAFGLRSRSSPTGPMEPTE